MDYPTTLVSVGGMLRVVTDPAQLPMNPESPQLRHSPPLPSSPSNFPSSTQETPRPSPNSPPQLLTQKQVRELRRLCRKTANRAEFDKRPIQLRQIASIAAMATPSAKFFEPHDPHTGHHLRKWVDTHREQGADWRDERPLPMACIDELRRWDRALKAWARLRFETPLRSPLHSRKPIHQPNFAPSVQASSPVTPYEARGATEYTHFPSPLSPDALSHASPVVPTPPRRPSLLTSDGIVAPGFAPPGVSALPRVGASLIGSESGMRMAPVGTAVQSSFGMSSAMNPVKTPSHASGSAPAAHAFSTPMPTSFAALSNGAQVGMPVRGTVGELVVGSTGTPGRMPGAALVGFPAVTSEHADVLASTVTPVTTPARDSYASRAEAGVGGGGATDSSASGANKVESSPVPTREGGLLSRLGSAAKHQQKSEVSISRVGDTINITVPTTLMSNMSVQDGLDDYLSRHVARDDQENVYPSLTKRPSYLHAANTAKSWRKSSTEQGGNYEYSLSAEKELAVRNAARSLFSNSSKETMVSGFEGTGQGVGRTDMDWGKLRRPVLRNVTINESALNQSFEKGSK